MNIRIFIQIVLILVLVSCEEIADIANAKFYEKAGISFQYPGNWSITEDEVSTMYRNIYVESPGDALMIIQGVDASLKQTLEDYAINFSQMSAESLPIGKADQSVFNSKDPYIFETLNITLLSESVPHKRKYHKVAGAKKSYYLISQSSIEDLDKTQAGFNLIFSSFKLTEHNEFDKN